MKKNLGDPIPSLPHAASVSLPLIKHVIGYEEGKEDIHKELKSGYPRFVLSKQVRSLIEKIQEEFCTKDEACLPLSTLNAAKLCQSVANSNEIKTRIFTYRSNHLEAHVVVAHKEHFKFLKRFWQNTGFIVSSRHAENLLNEQTTPLSKRIVRKLKERIADYAQCSVEDIYLFPTGMGAITAALQAVQHVNPFKRTVQFGFPYLDTLKIQDLLQTEPHFLPKGDRSELAAVRAILPAASAVFCEVTSNPLLKTPPLKELSEITRRHQVPLIIDDTLGTWFNVDTASYSDINVVSLTKYFSGSGNVSGGALILNKKSPLYSKLKKATAVFKEFIFPEDAGVLLENSIDMPRRLKTINKNALHLAQFLNSHELVKEVFYPGIGSTENYDALKYPNAGYGGLLSFTLKEGFDAFEKFYDSLQLLKGPGLGTNFTLVCPYTLIAHYYELEWAESHGVNRYLIRVSVGIENIQDIVNAFEAALDKTREREYEHDEISDTTKAVALSTSW